MTESELRARVVEYAHARGWLVFSLPMARTRRPVKDAVGYPDLTLARDRQVFWIELKTDEGAIRRDQLRWMRELPAMHVLRPLDWESGRVQEMLR